MNITKKDLKERVLSRIPDNDKILDYRVTDVWNFSVDIRTVLMMKTSGVITICHFVYNKMTDEIELVKCESVY